MEIKGDKVNSESEKRAITEARKAEHQYRSTLSMEASGGEHETEKERPAESKRTGYQSQTVQRSVRSQPKNQPRLELHYINFSDLL